MLNQRFLQWLAESLRQNPKLAGKIETGAAISSPRGRSWLRLWSLAWGKESSLQVNALILRKNTCSIRIEIRDENGSSKAMSTFRDAKDISRSSEEAQAFPACHDAFKKAIEAFANKFPDHFVAQQLTFAIKENTDAQP